MISASLVNLTATTDAPTAATLQVDVIADLICPWCYLGMRRLEDALAAVHGPSQVTWHPFQLNPTMPARGMKFEEYLRTKFGNPDKVRAGLEVISEAGAQEGINFRFDRLTRVPNTLDAHRLLQLAQISGCDTAALAEAILQAFFEYGRDISDFGVLAPLGESSGLDRTAIREALEDDASRRFVLAQESQVRQNGVTGVPDFLVNRRLFVIGAQPTESLVKTFDRVMFGEESDLAISTTIH